MERQASVHPADETLVSYGLGKLDDTIAESVNKHLQQCVPCRRRVAELSGDSFLGRLREAQAQPADVPPADVSPNDVPTRPKTLVEPDPPHPPPLAEKPAAVPAPPISRDKLPPELVNHPQYEVIRELGRGGMGVVYLAKNKLMDRLEVLKVMNKETLAKQGTADRFLREIQSAAKLHHPNVVAAYTAIPMGDLLVFAMEYVEGEDLSKLVRARGPLPVLNACYFAYQAAKGLDHAHQRGMIHRDIKPGNLILSRHGKQATVKILDFGLAKVTSEHSADHTLTREGQMLGTPDYIAPEQTLDAQKADIRADIYSLGCTLYHLLTGHPPFSGNSLYEVLQAHHSVDARPLNLVRPDVPVELAAVVSKMMAKEPKRRYQTPAEVVQALKPFLKPGGLSSPQPELSQVASQLDRAAAAASPAATPGDDDPSPVLAPMEAARPAERWKSLIDAPQFDRSSAVRSAIRKHARRQPPWMWPAAAASAVLLGLVIAWAGGVFKVTTKNGIIVLEDLPENAEVLVDGEKVTVQFPDGGDSAEITVPTGKHGVQVKKDGFKAFGEEVRLASGERRLLTVRLVRLPQRRPMGPAPAGDPDHGIAGSDTDRQVAQFVLSLGGTVGIRTGSEEEEFVKADEGLPARAFRLTRARLVDKPNLTDEDVARFKGLTNLIAVNVANAKKVTDASLKGLAGLNQLEVIRVPGTGITDAGLAYLQSLKKLRLIDVSRTQVTNAGLLNFQKLPQLETLRLGGTHVTGAGLVDLENLTSLRQLYFWDQNIANAGLAHLKNLTQLETLELVGTGINDEGIVHLKGLSKLRRLNLYHTRVTGSCFADPGGLAQITWLSLLWTPLTDANLANLQRLPQLEFLDLAGTGVTDAGLVNLRGLSKLKNLILKGTKVTGGGVEGLRSSLVGCRIAADAVALAAPPNLAEEKSGQSGQHSLGAPHFIRGDWKVENGELVQSSLGASGDCPTLVFGDNSLSSYNLTLDFKKTGGGDCIGAGFHWHGHDHFQLFALGAHHRFAELDSALNGQVTWGQGLSKPFDVETDRWYAVRLEIRGPAYRCLVDDRELFQRTDPRFSDGRLLLRTWSTTARFRNIKVTDPAGNLLLEGMPDLPANEPAKTTANDQRRAWKGLGASSFRNTEIGKWREEVHDGSAIYNFDEVARTPEYVELIDKTRAVGGCRIRLRDSEAQIIWGGRDDDWQTLEAGRWETSEPAGSSEREATPSQGTGTKTADGFVPLFNGRDLTGWNKAHSDTIDWTVANRALVGVNHGGPGSGGSVTTERADYRDFHLRCEAMLSEGPSATAILFRQSAAELNAGDVTGYFLFIPGTEQTVFHAGAKKIGSLLIGYKNALGEPLGEANDRSVEPGKWFQIGLTTRGPHFQVSIDGSVVVDCVDRKNACPSGAIGFVCRPGSTVRFRNIEIQKLGPTHASAKPITTRIANKQALTPAERLEMARMRFVAAMQAAKENLIKHFDAEIARTHLTGRTVAERIQMRDTLTKEKEAFEKKGMFPWSVPMRTPITTYVKSINRASEDFEKAYGKLFDAATKNKDEKSLDQLAAERASLLSAPQTIGEWEVTGMNVTFKWKWGLCSNGKAGKGGKGKTTWSLEGNDLVLRGPSPHDLLPVENRCTLAPDGRTFTGRNNRGWTYKGRLVEN